MKANDFVKKFGWEAVKHDFSIYFKDESIGTIKILTHCREYIEVDGDNLKRLVESHELVESCKGVDLSKSLITQAPKQASHWGYLNKSYYSYDDFYGQWKQYWDIPNAPMWQTVFSMQYEGKLISLRSLKQAVADVESCQ